MLFYSHYQGWLTRLPLVANTFVKRFCLFLLICLITPAVCHCILSTSIICCCVCICVCVLHLASNLGPTYLPFSVSQSYLPDNLGVLYVARPSTQLMLGKWSSVLQFLLLASPIFSKTNKQTNQKDPGSSKSKKLSRNPEHSYNLTGFMVWAASNAHRPWTVFWLQGVKKSQVPLSSAFHWVILGGGKLPN